MHKIRPLIAISTALLFAVASGALAPGRASGNPPPLSSSAKASSAKSVISGWPDASKKAANDMISKYGEPAATTPLMLVWNSQGDWREIIVYRDAVPHNFPKQHNDVLEGQIAFKVPADKFDDLAEFDGSLIIERTKGTLAARCDSEPMNYLALNLASEIVNDRMSVDDARDAYAQIAKDYAAGKQHPYTQGFQFDVAGLNETRDPDSAIIG